MAAIPPVCDFGAPIVDFTLPTGDGNPVSLADVKGENGTLVMFICNHCPYVMAVIDRIVRDAEALQGLGIGVVAVSANDVAAYPQDAPDKMVELAAKHGFTFPYLYDETQDVARVYDAVCTPDFFGYNAGGELQYRGTQTNPLREGGDVGERCNGVGPVGLRGPHRVVAELLCQLHVLDRNLQIRAAVAEHQSEFHEPLPPRPQPASSLPQSARAGETRRSLASGPVRPGPAWPRRW